jgi:hypothetical protein
MGIQIEFLTDIRESEQAIASFLENPQFCFVEKLPFFLVTRKQIVLEAHHCVLQDCEHQLFFRLQGNGPLHRVVELRGGQRVGLKNRIN